MEGKVSGKGKQTFKLGHGTLGAFQIPLLLLVGVAAIALIDRRPLWYGMLVASVGEAIQVWSASHLRKDKQLATSGPYARVRNPMYFGRFFVGLGITLMIKNPWLIAAYVILFVVYAKLRVGGEEAKLAGYFGSDYAEYCANVRQFLPRLTPYQGSAGAKAKWEFFARNHEYRNVVGLLVMFAAVCARVQFLPPLAQLFR
ncbi:MAG: isoprenylcysteine carboxylmethyltransferase family protein [Armatimonadota bacterium]|nr:isoprenylcysteine carboxylmethyltransferase family protein [Armatimonadota bacterium]